MTSPLAAYLPRVLLNEHVDGADLRHGTTRHFDAAAMFVDVAGFTPMSEALGRLGAVGTEDLRRVLNAWFGPTIDVIQRHGGDIVAFAGDALTVVFAGHADARQALRHATDCASELQDMAPAFEELDTAAGRFSLAVRIGIAHGPVVALVVGRTRLVHAVGGRAIDLAVEAEAQADLGEVSVAADRANPGGATTSTTAPAAPAAAPGAPTGSDDGDPIGRFVHPAIADRVATGRADLIDEHRTVTTLFVRVIGGDVHGDTPPAALADRLADMIEVIHDLDGHVRQVSMGDKGTVLIGLFGAPVAHDDDPVRGLACALTLRDGDHGPLAIGVTTARVFCGHVGSDARREYAVIGDAVNLSARLMQAASSGEILVDAATRRAGGAGFEWGTVTELAVKGKSVTTEVAPLLGSGDQTQERPADPTELLGREAETADATTILGHLLEGRGGMIEIVGEAGTGKTRLAAELLAAAGDAGADIHLAAFDAYGRLAPYHGWRPAIWSLLGLRAEDSGPAHVARRLAEIDEGLVSLAPILGDALGFETPAATRVSELDPEVRAGLLRRVVQRVVAWRCARAPQVIAVEDAHHADEASRELVRHVARTTATLPVVLLVASRPQGRPDLPGVAGGRVLELRDLPDVASAELARRRLRKAFDAEPHDDLVLTVAEHAGGNPLFIERLADLLAQRGIDPRVAVGVHDLDLPPDLSSVVLARIDRLDASDQATLKYASVLGHRFNTSWFSGSFPQLGSPDEAAAGLDRLGDVDLIVSEVTTEGTARAFQHVVIRDVAYETLSLALRRDLHTSAGRHLSEVLPHEAGLVAHHFGHSDSVDDQRIWFERAGDQARAVFANEDAIAWFERLLPLVTDDDTDRITLQLGSVLEHVARWDEAEQAYERTTRSGSPALRVRAMTSLGLLRSYTEPTEAAGILGRARRAAAELDDPDLEARLLEALAWTFWSSSQHEAARAVADELLEVAVRQHDPAREGAARKSLGDIAWALGDLAGARASLIAAGELARQADDPALLVHVDAALVGVLASDDDHRAAVRHLQDAVANARRIGYQHVAEGMRTNEAELRRLEGDLDGAIICGRDALRSFGSLGDVAAFAATAGNLADALASRGDRDAATEIFELALGIGRPLRAPGLAEIILYYARCRAAMGDEGAATELAGDALATAEAAADATATTAARVALALLTRDPSLLPTDETVSTDGQRAGLRWARWKLDPSRIEDRRTAADAYARLHPRAPKAEYRVRYRELTGEDLTDPPSLPPLDDDPVAAEALVDEVRTYAGLLGADVGPS